MIREKLGTQKTNQNISINSLFHKFALAIHNLVYGEMIEQNIFELLFLNTEGNA